MAPVSILDKNIKPKEQFLFQKPCLGIGSLDLQPFFWDTLNRL